MNPTNVFALVGLRDDPIANNTVDQPKMLVQQVGSVVLLSTVREGRLASPLAILSPQRLEFLYLLVLPRNLEIFIYSSPRTVECTNDPAR